MASNDDVTGRRRPRLRIPAALAVAIVGTSATAALSAGGCDNGSPEPIDASSPGMARIDAAVDAEVDGELPEDAQVDAMPDTPVT
jgi:hypothetical protein